MAAQMRCTVSSLPFGHVVRVFGEVDLATAPALAEVLAQVASGSVIADLTDVTFMDAAGLNALVAAQRYLERHGASLFVQGASARLERLFEITGIGVLFGKEPCALDA